MTAKPAAIAPTTALRQGHLDRQEGPHRPAAGHRGGDRRAPDQEEGAGDLQLGRHQLERLRHRRDPPRPGRRRRDRDHGQPQRGVCHRDHARGGLHQLPPDRPRVPQRRRRVRGLDGEPGQVAGAGRRRRAAGRLHPHRGRVDVVGSPADHLCAAEPAAVERGHRRAGDPADHAGQPARHPRVRQHLRHPHLPVRRQRAAHRCSARTGSSSREPGNSRRAPSRASTAGRRR